MKFTKADIERADREMEDLSSMGHYNLTINGEMGMLESMGVDDEDLVQVTIDKGFSPMACGFWCAGFATAMRMVQNAEAENEA